MQPTYEGDSQPSEAPVLVNDSESPFAAAPTVQTAPPAPAPTYDEPADTGGCCDQPRVIPTACEIDILIKLLDIAISGEHQLAAQWLRLSFHDAGTFKTTTNEGGAKGCLMNYPDFQDQPENAFLDLPIQSLATVRSSWQNHPDTCLLVSSADMIQFAGLFSSLRQVSPAGIDSSKRDALLQFGWGRPDEPNCDLAWVDNLPGFRLGAPPGNIPLRCLNAGGEIKKKMMDRNGFTAEEAAALIGAHTIGLTRSSFGTGLANPWVVNGGDNATPEGPVFDNAFHSFMADSMGTSSIAQFASTQYPFDATFPDWFMDSNDGVNYLDTDVAIAFPSQDIGIHPDFHTFTAAFGADNDLFLLKFFAALGKMSKLGVDASLLSPASDCTACDGSGEIPSAQVAAFVSDLGTAKAVAEELLRLKQESPELTVLRESDSVALQLGAILSVDDSLRVVAKVQVAITTEAKEAVLAEVTTTSLGKLLVDLHSAKIKILKLLP